MKALALIEKVLFRVFLFVFSAAVLVGAFSYWNYNKMETVDPIPAADSRWEFVQEVPNYSTDVDLNEDGEITQAELVDFSRNHPRPEGTSGADWIARLRKDTRQAHSLRKRDLNGDGVVTLSETYQYLRLFDEDGDGHLSDEEHLKAEDSLRPKVPAGLKRAQAASSQSGR